MWPFKRKPKEKLPFKQKFKKEAPSMVVLIILILAFRSIIAEPFKIPSGSMIPTLLIGDFILVNKLAYGLKVPFSDWYSDPVYITEPGKPDRGDVVVFKFPQNPEINYIKRVVGLPGDSIEVIDKIVYINDKAIEMNGFDGKEIMEDMDEKYKSKNFKFFNVKTGEHDHVVQLDEDGVYNSNYYKTRIPDGHYFVMGDNRDFSYDSRGWGFVPFENIKGEAILIWFSMSIPFPWAEGEEDYFTFRPWRIGTMID